MTTRIAGRIERRVTQRKCPDCGWRVAALQVERAAQDYRCLYCRQRRFSEFLAIYEDDK